MLFCLHAKELALKLKEMKANVTANSVHPGVVKTGITRERDGLYHRFGFFFTSKLVKSIPQAASTTCCVAGHPNGRTSPENSLQIVMMHSPLKYDVIPLPQLHTFGDRTTPRTSGFTSAIKAQKT